MTKKIETTPKVEDSPKVNETITETVQETFEKAGDMLDNVLNQEQELPFEPENPNEKVPFDNVVAAKEEAAAQKAKEEAAAQKAKEEAAAQKAKEEAAAQKAKEEAAVQKAKDVADTYDNWFERFDTLLRQKHYYSYLNCGRLLKKPIYRENILLFKKEFAAYGCSSDIDIQVTEMLQNIPEQ